tara:strand:- start:4 stop:657 length:654 start_codon:yes stop_codon:yes gene_type:complete
MIKLTYFNIEGLAEKIRLALKIGKCEHEDIRINFNEWNGIKNNTPYGQLPMMNVDGIEEPIAQSGAILRYVGKKTNLYPNNDLEALYIDELVSLQEDISSKIGVSIYIGMKPETYGYPSDLSDDDKKIIQKTLRQNLANEDGDLHKFLNIVNNKLSKDKFFTGDFPTIADCAFLPLFRQLRSGRLDYLPIWILNKYENICKFEDNMMNIPEVKLHYS